MKNSFKMDLSKFKKVHETEHSTRLLHPKGHTIEVAHKALSSKMKEQLARLPVHMADGGFYDPIYGTFSDKQEEFTPSDPTQALLNQNSSPIRQVAMGPELQEQFNKPQNIPSMPQNYSIPQPDQQAPDMGMASQMAGMNAQMGGYQQAIDKLNAGFQTQANAEAEKARLEHEAILEQQKRAQKVYDDYQSNLARLNQEHQAIKDDVANSRIDPNRYMNSKSGGEKVLTAIGLILGGMGGGLMHQENPALKFLNAQIDRDIKAQMEEMGKKNNLLAANFKEYGNMQDATNATRAFYADMYATKLQDAAAKTNDDMAKARALQAAGQLQMQVAPAMAQIAMRGAIMNGLQRNDLDPATAVRFIVPDNRQAEAYKEIKEQENINHINKNAMDSFDKIAKLQTFGSRLGSPIQSGKQIDAQWNPMLDLVTKNTTGRVVPITVELMEDIKPQFTDDAETTAIKRQKFFNLLNGERSTPVLDSYGIRMNKLEGQAKPLGSMTGYNR